MKKRNSGFSLIELLVVCACIMIIAAIAIIAYQGAIAKARKAEAVDSLRDIQTAEIDFYNAYGEYTYNLSDLGPGHFGSIPGDLATGEKGGYLFHVYPCGRGRGRSGFGCFHAFALPSNVHFLARRFWKQASMCADQTGALNQNGPCG